MLTLSVLHLSCQNQNKYFFVQTLYAPFTIDVKQRRQHMIEIPQRKQHPSFIKVKEQKDKRREFCFVDYLKTIEETYL